jgi:hypothetical protein
MEYLNCNIPRALLDVKEKLAKEYSAGQSKDWPLQKELKHKWLWSAKRLQNRRSLG